MTIPNSLTASIALHNSEDTIQRAVSSIQGQTWSGPLEILIVDDFSTDNSASIVEQLQLNDDRIRLIKLDKNSGLGAVRNIQIKEAKCEYLAFLDSDDVWMPEKIARQFDELFKIYDKLKTDNVLCSVNLLYFNHETGLGRNSIQPSEPYEIVDILRWGVNRPTPVIAACLGKNQVFKDVGPFDENLRKAQDWDFSIRFHVNGGKFSFVSGEPLYKYFYTGMNRDPFLTEQSIKYLLKKHEDLFERYGLYREVLAEKLYKFLADLYLINGREFESFQKKYEAASMCPDIYGKLFVDSMNIIIDKRIKTVQYNKRIHRIVVNYLKCLVSKNR